MGPGVWLRRGWFLALWCLHTARLLGFSHFRGRIRTGGDLNKNTTMTPVVNVKAVRKLFLKNYPPFVIPPQQKLIYTSKEAGEALDISNPAWPLQQSLTKSLHELDSLSVIFSNQTDEALVLIQQFRAHPHCFRLLRCYLRLNKPEVASSARWGLRELIPLIDPPLFSKKAGRPEK